MKSYLKRVLRALMNKPIYAPAPVQTYSLKREYVIEVCSESKRFAGKVALVIGASGWIGKAISRRFAIEGATVYLAGRNLSKLQELSDLMQQEGGEGIPCVLSFDDESSVQSASDRIVAEKGKIDILVNCAGGSARDKMANLIDQETAVIDEVIRSNLRGAILCTKVVGKQMADQGSGAIVNIASVIGEQGKAKCAEYAAAKAGILGFSKSAAQELGPRGVTVNCVSPGFIQRESYTDKRLPYLLNSNFMHQIGTAEDIAAAVAFIASDEAGFITGQNLCVDGGRSLGLHGD